MFIVLYVFCFRHYLLVLGVLDLQFDFLEDDFDRLALVRELEAGDVLPEPELQVHGVPFALE